MSDLDRHGAAPSAWGGPRKPRGVHALAAVVAVVSLAACTSGGPRPVATMARPAVDTLERLRIDPLAPQEPPPLAVIAVPTAGPGEGDGAPDVSAAGGGTAGPGPLQFHDVLRSVERDFPLVLAALEEVEIAEGELLSAEGGFDLRAKADAQLGVQGFYENEVGKVVLEQPTAALGTRFFTGYKFGTGDFPVWEGGLKTQDQGEFAAGVIVPLLAGREIDARRLALYQARVQRAQAEPRILQKRLEATRKAALAYWKWVSAGQKLAIAERLLELAESRSDFVRINVEIGELEAIAVEDNQRLVVDREATVVLLTRTLEQAAIELSLYLRDAEGQPRLPSPVELPPSLPVPRDPSALIASDDFERALRLRPEVRDLELSIERLELERAKAENDLLPKLDLGVAASQDVGDPVSEPDDKGPFELDALVNFDLPLQRRAARGKLRSLDAKLRKTERELQFARDRVLADLRRFDVELRRNYERLDRVREGARYAGILEEAERNKFEIGESDLLRVNIREQQTAAAAAKLVDAIALHFLALAEYRASLGVPYDEVGTRTSP